MISRTSMDKGPHEHEDFFFTFFLGVWNAFKGKISTTKSYKVFIQIVDEI